MKTATGTVTGLVTAVLLGGCASQLPKVDHDVIGGPDGSEHRREAPPGPSAALDRYRSMPTTARAYEKAAGGGAARGAIEVLVELASVLGPDVALPTGRLPDDGRIRWSAGGVSLRPAPPETLWTAGSGPTAPAGPLVGGRRGSMDAPVDGAHPGCTRAGPAGYAGPAVASRSDIVSMRVRPGTTWWGLARRHAMDYALLAAMNGRTVADVRDGRALPVDGEVFVLRREGVDRRGRVRPCGAVAQSGDDAWHVFPGPSRWRSAGDPGWAAERARDAAPAPALLDADAEWRVPGAGDTFRSIASAAGVALDAVLRYNGLDPAKVAADSTPRALLALPAGARRATAAVVARSGVAVPTGTTAAVACDGSRPARYAGPLLARGRGVVTREVASGDTWWGLGRAHGASYGLLAAMNGVDEARVRDGLGLFLGTTVYLPSAGGPASVCPVKQRADAGEVVSEADAFVPRGTIAALSAAALSGARARGAVLPTRVVAFVPEAPSVRPSVPGAVPVEVADVVSTATSPPVDLPLVVAFALDPSPPARPSVPGAVPVAVAAVVSRPTSFPVDVSVVVDSARGSPVPAALDLPQRHVSTAALVGPSPVPSPVAPVSSSDRLAALDVASLVGSSGFVSGVGAGARAGADGAVSVSDPRSSGPAAPAPLPRGSPAS